MGAYSALLGFALVVILASQASAQNCSTSLQSTNGTKTFTRCNSLPTLNATLAWTYFPANGSIANGSIAIGFRATPAASAGWVAWGINPTTAGQMVGTQALIAFKHSNGSAVVGTYNIKDQNPPQPSSISITVSDMSVIIENSGQISIFATLALPSNKTTVNHVWQVGSAVSGLVPQSHAFNAANLGSAKTIDLQP